MNSMPGSIQARFQGTFGSFSLDVDIKAPLHGITALFGPSGCGKTTILRCMAGLNRLPGKLQVGDDLWQDDDKGIFRKPYERPIGYVFQEASLFPHLSVLGNLNYGARRANRTSSDTVITLDEIVNLLGIGHLLERSPSSLSGGERQRIAIGRALFAQPRLLMMDEPLSALDRQAKDEILPCFDALHKNLSIPILYVSHNIQEVAQLADTMIVLLEGKRIDSGPVQEILEHLDPGNEHDIHEVAVILHATVIEHQLESRMTRLDHNGQTIAIPATSVEVGEQVRLRVRSRDVVLATERPSGISVRNILAGTVKEVTENPETAYASVLVDITGARLRALITRDAVNELHLAPGMGVFALVKSISIDKPISSL